MTPTATVLADEPSRDHQPTSRRRKRRWPKVVAWILGSLAAIVVAVALAFKLSVWPSVWLIRWQFDRGVATSEANLAPFVPASGISKAADLAYEDRDGALLDIYWPSSVDGTDEVLPTIFWIHGGGWVWGDKGTMSSWAQILADEGYTVVAMDYTIAPDAHYPEQVREAFAALAYLNEVGSQYHVDTSQLVIAGDSAGAQIAAQVVQMSLSPEYAEAVGVPATIESGQIAAVVLQCGAYDIDLVKDATGLGGWFIDTVMWAYSGERNWKDDDAAFVTGSVYHYVTAGFPPTFISGGNADPLTPQGKALAAKLEGLGVDVTAMFFPDDYEPALGHEYNMNLSSAEGMANYREMMSVIAANTAP